MQHFEARYKLKSMGKASRVFAMAAAHHRLNYIHPFVDGNGRVSRLMSHAMAHLAGIGAHGLWSISRGLARGLSDAGEYKRMMDDADSPRRGDLDGRGNLSREALIEFVSWFAQVALDQLNFMQGVFDFDALDERLTRYVTDALGLADHAARIPTEVLRRGELARGEISRITQKPEQTARAALSALTRAGLLVSDTPKGPVRLNFTVASANVLFPRLFGAQSA